MSNFIDVTDTRLKVINLVIPTDANGIFNLNG